jgi:hypothetical protein
MTVDRQQLGKHVTVATNTHVTTELLEVVFYMQPVPRLHNEDQRDKSVVRWQSALSCHPGRTIVVEHRSSTDNPYCWKPLPDD